MTMVQLLRQVDLWNSEIQGIVESGGDRDWFSISLDAGSTYKFDLKHVSIGDPYLKLYDLSKSFPKMMMALVV